MADITVSFNGTPVGAEMGHLVSVEVETAINLPGRFLLVFSDPAHTIVKDLNVTTGTAVTLTSGTTPLLTGEVTALEVEYEHQLGTLVIIRGYDKLHRLQNGRCAQVFPPESTFADVLAKITSAYGLTPGDTSGAPTTVLPWIGQRDVSDWELLLALAEEAGAVVGLSTEGALNFVAPTQASSAPDVSSPSSTDALSPLQLVPDNNLLRVRAVSSGAQQASGVTVRSWDVMQKQAVVATQGPATFGVAATLTPSSASQTLNGSAFVEARTSVPDQSSAAGLATSLADRIGSTVGEIDGIAVANPQLKAGVAVSLGNLGPPFDGKYVLSTVRQHFSSKTGNRTFFTASGRQDRTLLGLTNGTESAIDRRANRFAGVVNAIVTDIDDPNKMGRVKVQVVMWDDKFVSDWARVVQAGTGSKHGSFLPPQVNDEVLVAFENNDLRRPVVLGGLYNGVDTPNLGDSDLVDNGIYIRRGITSTLGSMLLFFDGSAKEGIALVSSDKQYKMSLNKTQKQIKITVAESGGKIIITSAGDISIESTAGDVSIKGINIKLQASASFKVQSSGGASIEDDSSVAIKGAQVTLN